MANEKYQTLEQFILKPFGSTENMERDTKLNQAYQRIINTQKISIVATTEIEKSFYYHILIPSESQKTNRKDYYYDVVLRFFTEDPSISKEKTLNNYYIQFYSNSPSFIYQYAYLYNRNGFLISELYSRTDAEYINTPPTKTNADMNMTYDKSIYLACKYLYDHKTAWMSKIGPATVKRVPKNRFFKSIGDFQSIKLDKALMAEEKKLARELSSKEKRDVEREEQSTKKKSSLSTTKGKSSINIKQKITGKKASKTIGVKRTKTIRPKLHT